MKGMMKCKDCGGDCTSIMKAAQRALIVRGWRPTLNAVGSVTDVQLQKMKAAQKQYAKERQKLHLQK